METSKHSKVSILVLMEDVKELQCNIWRNARAKKVSILVLMEDVKELIHSDVQEKQPN